MANFRGFNLPSFGASMSVAWETLKAKWPENSPCMELIRGPGPGYGQQPPQQQEHGGGFQAFGEDGEHTEMTTMNGEQEFGGQNNVAMAEDSFSYQRNGYFFFFIYIFMFK